jgi:hypothetical protein
LLEEYAPGGFDTVLSDMLHFTRWAAVKGNAQLHSHASLLLTCFMFTGWAAIITDILTILQFLFP